MPRDHSIRLPKQVRREPGRRGASPQTVARIEPADATFGDVGRAARGMGAMTWGRGGTCAAQVRQMAMRLVLSARMREGRVVVVKDGALSQVRTARRTPHAARETLSLYVFELMR